jgi:hypothetical protein
MCEKADLGWLIVRRLAVTQNYGRVDTGSGKALELFRHATQSCRGTESRVRDDVVEQLLRELPFD